MEDFNIPNPERVALLERLQDAMGGAPPHFWAASQIRDLKALERLVQCGHEYPEILRAFSQQTIQWHTTVSKTALFLCSSSSP
jgi:hypothetical protein